MVQRQDSRPYIRQIDFMFYHEKEIRRAVEDARNERETPDIRNGSGLPDPTASEAIKLLTPVKSVLIGGHDEEVNGQMVVIDAQEVQYPERWLTVIDQTYAWCKEQPGLHYEVARRRYSGEFYTKSCIALSMCEKNFFILLEKVRTQATHYAVQLGLIYFPIEKRFLPSDLL